MAIEKGSKNLHELSVSFLVELGSEWTPYDRAEELYDRLTELELVSGMGFNGSRSITFEAAVKEYDPKIWGEDVLCSTACDVNVGCECHGGYEE